MLFLPVAVDDVPAPRDWVLVVVQGNGGRGTLGEAEQLEVRVHDWAGRKGLSEKIAGSFRRCSVVEKRERIRWFFRKSYQTVRFQRRGVAVSLG